MEGTQPNTQSNAATRKRRSSILKSQRPPRTPFSEIELTVATPTDTVKSRRVSFSRLTGVAEFITNQATTTWKSFYEEHNKSLESSSQEPPVNVPRPVGHISKRIFEQQFQDVESEIDFVDTTPHRGRHREPSLNIDISNQLAALESTENSKLLPDPKQNFELSALTDHQSKVFSDDLANPTMPEFSDRIDVNFSVVDPLLRTTQMDDLDEIQKHLEQAQPSNFICQGPSRERREVSQYIEVDLNMTHATVQNDEYDMSITDTINSPKVNVSKTNHSLTQPPVKKDSTNCDWEADKENIVNNPYVTPHETDNFAINDEPNKVLVFDGKRLTVESEKADVLADVSRNPQNKKKYIAPTRKTIVLNLDDDLPNFVDDINVSTVNGSSRKEISIAELKKTIIYEEEDLSITQAVTKKNNSDLMTQVYSSDLGNISMTQALPGNILTNKKRQTIIYANDTGDISMTQAISANILLNKITTEEHLNMPNTTVFDKNDISMTQALPTKIEATYNQVTRINENFGDISMTQALPSNILSSKKRCTIVFDNNAGDISMTQALPPNIFIPNSSTNAEVNKPNKLTEEQITTEDNLSMTEALSENILSTKRKTMYENELGDISITQALPPRILLDEINNERKQKSDESKPSEFVLSSQYAENDMQPGLSKTEVYDADDIGDISMTQVLPSNIIVNKKRRTIIYDNDTADISVTQALPPNILIDSAIIPDVVTNLTVKADDISLSLAAPNKEILLNETKSVDEYKSGNKKRCTIVFENSNADISVTSAIPQNILEANLGTDLKNSSVRDAVEFHNISSKCKLLETAAVFSKDLGSSTLSRPIPNKFIQEVYLVHEQQCDKLQLQTTDSIVAESGASSAQPSDLTLDSATPKAVDVTKEKSIIDNLLDMDSSSVKLVAANNSFSAVSSSTNAECEVKSTRTPSQNTDFSSVEGYPTLPLEFKESEDDKMVELERKDDFLFNVSKPIDVITAQNESVSRTDVSQDNDDIVSELKMENKTDDDKTVNNTNDLSNMLSQYKSKTIEKHDKTNDISVKCRMSLGNVNEYVQPRRLSFASNRPSIVLSREDMLNNLSMAQALLQKSTYHNDTDESVNLEDTIDQSTQSDHKNNQVVKMLTFEDDGDDQGMEVNDEECGKTLRSPLKKLTFLEDSPANDKSKVIPSYLRDVSNCMKELMLDLVKPMADVRQTELKDVHGDIATSSQQIQANLVASSQIDSDSSASSMHDVRSERTSSKSKGNVTFDDVPDVMVSPNPEVDVPPHRQNPLLLEDPSHRVLQFDPENPLNNILIMPRIIPEPHPYPKKSSDCITPSVSDEYDLKESDSNTDSQSKVERTQTDTYNFYRCSPKRPYPVQDELAFNDKESLRTCQVPESLRTCQVPESQSTTTTEWTSLTSTKGFPHLTEVKDAKENTVIAMVNNESLLASQPSLGLIDDGIDFDLSSTRKTIFSPLLMVDVSGMNRKKRSLSVTPTKQMQATHNEPTLKPILKMPRISNSPLLTKSKGTSISSVSETEYGSAKTTLDKATVVTVARCMTSSFKHGSITEEVEDSVKVSNSTSDEVSHDSSEGKLVVKQPSTVNTWDIDKKLSATDAASCFNVITTIDQLPFMGTEELEWESWSGDTWGFRLERGRLRLSVRLAHRVGNSLRTLVRADTPVRSLQLSTPAEVPTEDVLSWLCSSYAAVDMYGAVEAGVCHAAQVPALLRRLAASARLAGRWAQAIGDIRTRLALSLHQTDPMLLKVANVPLRSVWEVLIWVELGRDPARLAVWPRASRVSVATLAGDTFVSSQELNDLIADIPDDWGHVPKAIWKIFKYLKVKKPVDKQMLAMRSPILKQHIPV